VVALRSNHETALIALGNNESAMKALRALGDEIRLEFISRARANMSHGEMGAIIGAQEVLNTFLDRISGMAVGEVADEGY
jgi:hypothetical protein